MDGRYTGWLEGKYGRITDTPMTTYWSLMPENKRAWAASHYKFTHADDSNENGKEVYDIFFQQLIEAINEKRNAIKTYVPHPNVSQLDWSASWRNLTWQDYSVGQGVFSLKSLIDQLRDSIWNYQYNPADTEWNVLNPRLNPVGYYFCYPIDDDYKGTNWKRFETESELLSFSAVGSIDADGDTAYTMVPARYGYEALYLKRMYALGAPERPLFFVEYLWELKRVLNTLQYLYPALGFRLFEYIIHQVTQSDCRPSWTAEEQKSWHAEQWDMAVPIINGYSGLNMPYGGYAYNGTPPLPCTEPEGTTHINGTAAIEYHWIDTLPLWDMLVNGHWTYQQTSETGWIKAFAYNQKEAGVPLMEKLFSLGAWGGSWDWEVIFARLKPNFDYHI